MLGDARDKLRAQVKERSTRFVLAYDNMNWVHKVKDKSSEARSTMKAAVDGNVAFVDCKTKYQEVQIGFPRASLELFRKTFDNKIGQPTTHPSALHRQAAVNYCPALKFPWDDRSCP